MLSRRQPGITFSLLSSAFNKIGLNITVKIEFQQEEFTKKNFFFLFKEEEEDVSEERKQFREKIVKKLFP